MSLAPLPVLPKKSATVGEATVAGAIIAIATMATGTTAIVTMGIVLTIIGPITAAVGAIRITAVAASDSISASKLVFTRFDARPLSCGLAFFMRHSAERDTARC